MTVKKARNNILGDNYRLRVSENRALRRMFGLKRDEVTGGWKKKLHNEELHNLYSSPSIIRMIKSWRLGEPWRLR
jgi:PAS domain-containing protein